METLLAGGRPATRTYLDDLRRHLASMDWAFDQRTASLLRRVIEELEEALAEDDRRLHQLLEEELDLTTAASRSGTPRSTLSRYVDDGTIPVTAQRPITVKLRHLPCKPGWIASLIGIQSPPSDTNRSGDEGEPEEDVSKDAVSEEEIAEVRRARLQGVT